MAADDSLKKLRRKKNPLKKKIGEEANSELRSSHPEKKETNSYRANEENKKNKNKKKKKNSPLNIANEVDSKDEVDDVSGGNKKSKKLRNNKRKKTEELVAEPSNEVEDGISSEKYVESEIAEEDKLQKKSRKKKRINNGDEVSKKDDASEKQNGKSKKAGKRKQRSRAVANELSVDSLPEKADAEDEVYEMSSGDEDHSKGMKKWIMQYHQSRPGLEVLQERIDDFIVAHEAKEEQAKLEREAKAAEGGWTVVVHHKGRKKTTEDETGVAVGSVAQAAVLDKMAKKKNKEVGLDFYRFQKREAQRNEVMMLQSKFEEDKKRIQQLRAARKFRPY
ncbi:hypothetical protein ABFS82_11G093900 [Erythranthe guttata]|nr:PREDICTED: uncharacterized protein LOC105955801 [Erythranthe guttata]|eukprot:XP_012835050.1 PREDICTED: uncharacterized protein LOC105955801 [Erythranthe guttata]